MTTLPKMDTDKEEGEAPDNENAELVSDALKLYDDHRMRELHNIEAAYDDLEFRAGNQWPQLVEVERIAQGRPCQTINQMPQYVRQVTGDMRQMRPAIKVVPIDDTGDEEKAEALGGVIRYIENRSDAPGVYFQGADSQVACGIGAWRIETEYASESTFNQELRIAPIEDAISIAWDLDAVLPTKEDAMKCLVPFDVSREKFKAMFPKATISEFAPLGDQGVTYRADWNASDSVRIGEYWFKKAVKKTLALMEDGGVEDLTDAPPEVMADAKARGLRIEKRDAFKVYRCLVTASEVIEGPTEWPGSYIPIIPVIGEEIRIGRRVVRHGVIRFAKDPQRTLNYMSSAETEVIALQPKAPFIGTEKNFLEYQGVWETANLQNHPYLPYTPDPSNGNAAPQRVPPAVASQGIVEGLARAERNIQSVIGIYNASLGAASNETSGKAVIARQREGDTGTYVYIDNWGRAIRYTGKVLADLIPKIYDTARVLRIVGEDGKVEKLEINQVGGLDQHGQEWLTNDVTVGSYDVALEMGPSYSTKREEARDGMLQLVQAAPDLWSMIGDLIVKSQDWPMADKIAARLEMALPPAIKQLEAQDGKQIPDMPPDPQQQAAMQAQQGQQQLDQQKLELEGQKLQVEMRKLDVESQKIEADMAKTQMQAHTAMNPPPAPAPAAPAQPESDPRIESIVQAVQDLQEGFQQIVAVVQQLAQPPQPEPPPDPSMGMMPMTEQQPPPQGGFFNGAE